MTTLRLSRGRPLPLGASRSPDGINFCVLSRHATAVSLVFYPEDGGGKPIAEIELCPRRNRTGDHWHVRVHDLPEPFCYGWRVDGPKGPKHRFDPSRVLIDPASTMLSSGAVWAGTCETDPERTGRRTLFVRGRRYDWEDDSPPLTPHEDTVVYEVHVRGFTRHSSSGVAHPGTFVGLIEKLPYLKWLGVTAIELLPVHEFDECDCPFYSPETGEKLVNFWGYNTIAFAAPKAAFAASADEHGQVYEFRDLVKACHKEGIEVYMDVVFNHTGEGDDRGRAYSLRGLDNELYYLSDEAGRYLNYSGCGNTVNCNHPLVRDLILTCLRYWVGDMHVDGFRFDLASILGRDRYGNVMVEPPVVEMIAEDGVLADTKLIAEPWDAAGLYQVGGFPFGRRWSEWNGRYRDDVRRFWRGDGGFAGALASRLCGSADLYQWSGRLPRHSLNFITAHDGFTLWDLVSYNHKHNDANGEGNRDGTNDDYAWNGGIEGETTDPGVLALRTRRAKGLMATLLMSQGVPMFLAGDEFLRTQGGNNNAWCQDNDVSWVDWTLQEKNKDFLRFVREMIWLRRRHPIFRRRRFFVGTLSPVAPPLESAPGFPSAGPVRPGETGAPTDETGRHSPTSAAPTPGAAAPSGARRPQAVPRPPLADIHWHGVEPYKPDFGPYARHLAFTLDGRFTGRDGDPDYRPDNDFYVVMNVTPGPLTFTVPASPTGRRWHLLVDTAATSPADFFPEGEGPPVAARAALAVQPFGMIVLISEP
ncbi:glycogen debranching protein GlgX [Fimbriiglobus ruber]|uniref:Glycogen debranching enzyme n=1 Tax=Fimbriiglobus ruber TaxID=1908690 RepID=A0A225DJD3_9BACT|nr:glycogen debranching protein GlgX [Fimbriiglobus ruber]OWK37546.1 Glycogen debranching enzyme [Fimbriiglobus ruber]